MNTAPSDANTNPTRDIADAAPSTNMRYKPMPTDHEIEKARQSMTRQRFQDWLTKRTAAAQADTSTAIEPFPIFDRADRREADRKAPRDDGHRRLYKGDPARTEPYTTYRVSGAAVTKGPKDYQEPS